MVGGPGERADTLLPHVLLDDKNEGRVHVTHPE